jgi:hypothetical protein
MVSPSHLKAMGLTFIPSSSAPGAHAALTLWEHLRYALTFTDLDAP